MNLRAAGVLLFWGILSFRLDGESPASSLDRETRFDSVESFVAAISAFVPDRSDRYLAWQFALPGLGQPGSEKYGKVIRASAVASCVTLWSNADMALVYATARPPIEATHAEAGVLFLLQRGENKWSITDLKTFAAYGKNCSVEARLTSEAAGGGATLDPTFVVITVTESGGGQHLSSSRSASYRISGFSLTPAGLE